MIYVVAYLPAIMFAGSAAWLTIEARYWPAFFLAIGAALFIPDIRPSRGGDES